MSKNQNDSPFESWIEIAHRLFIEVDNATGLEWPDIVYFDDDLLVGARYERIFERPASASRSDKAMTSVRRAFILVIIAFGMMSCTAAQVPTDKLAYCEAHPTATLPDGTDCSDISGRTGAE